jgi:type III secretion protein Q
VKRPVRPADASCLRPLARAALPLKQAAALCQAGAQAAAKIGESLSAELKAPLRCTGRVAEAPARAGGLPEGCCYLILALGVDGRRALLELETGTAASLVDKLWGGEGGTALPQELSDAEIACVSYLALHAVRAARSVDALESVLSPRFLAVARDVGEAGAVLAQEHSWVAVELELDLAGVKGGGRLLLPARTATRIARSSQRTALRAPLAAEIGKASLSACLVAGAADLTESEISRLSEGDAVVLSGLSRHADGVRGRASLLFADGFHLHGQLEGRAFTVASAVDALCPESPMNDAKTLISALPIEVQIELARLKIPLSKLDQLQPGAVLDLNTALTEPVILRVGDRAVAQAELVDIEGELGARILALLP